MPAFRVDKIARQQNNTFVTLRFFRAVVYADLRVKDTRDRKRGITLTNHNVKSSESI